MMYQVSFKKQLHGYNSNDGSLRSDGNSWGHDTMSMMLRLLHQLILI